MNRISFIATLAAVLGSLLAAPAQAAISRTYVASTGLDTNASFSCDFAHPCRTFQVALSQTTSGGEILAVDGSGYGPVTIDRSVSIIANPGAFAGIGVFASGTGVTIATAGVNVVLRGLTINGQGGTFGVDMSNGTRLSIENCVFANFVGASTAAIYVHTAATVRIINTLARDNSFGVFITTGAAASISESQFLGSGTAGIVLNGGTATVSASVMTGNIGLWNASGTLKSPGNNNLIDNAAPTLGSITSAPLM